MNEFSMYEYLGILKNIKDSINEIKLNLYEFESLIKNNIIDDGNIIDYEEIVNCINKLSLLSSSIEKRNLDRVDRFRKDEIREKKTAASIPIDSNKVYAISPTTSIKEIIGEIAEIYLKHVELMKPQVSESLSTGKASSFLKERFIEEAEPSHTHRYSGDHNNPAYKNQSENDW